jgi:hypothetical protein
MPKDFTQCVNAGGRIRTKVVSPKKGEYMHICFDKKGKSHAGEVKQKKGKNK